MLLSPASFLVAVREQSMLRRKRLSMPTETRRAQSPRKKKEGLLLLKQSFF
jgi:hypothetical protein